MFLLKVDFEKAFDCVNWDYIDSVMTQMGFGQKWIFWIRGCLSSARASVLINGSATREFPVTKGVRQGDPLSPFLFILAMEGLNMVMESASERTLFQGIQIPNSDPPLTHQFYADDALFLGEWTISNFKNLARILTCFHATSGLKVYGLGVEAGELEGCAQIMGCVVDSLPFKYLGVPVGANMSRKKHWLPVIERVQNRLSTWKSKMLSFGGRLTLVKSVLGSLPTFYLSIFKAPRTVIDTLERLRRRLLWGGSEERNKINWVAWKVVLGPKDKGGLGVGSLMALNSALLFKWLWRFYVDPDSLWRQVINGIHNGSRKPIHLLGKKTLNGTWYSIVKILQDLAKLDIEQQSIFRFSIKSGNNIRFWLDKWAGNNPLAVSFPRLYKLEKIKTCSLKDRLVNGSFEGVWKKMPNGTVELSDLHDLILPLLSVGCV
ncbi:hypothetical protein LXL04_013625 [Taraxacum kok-saghyz]